MQVRDVHCRLIELGDGLTIETQFDDKRIAAEVMYAAAMYRASEKVQAIRHVRATFGTQLKEAKRFCERAFEEIQA